MSRRFGIQKPHTDLQGVEDQIIHLIWEHRGDFGWKLLSRLQIFGVYLFERNDNGYYYLYNVFLIINTSDVSK